MPGLKITAVLHKYGQKQLSDNYELHKMLLKFDYMFDIENVIRGLKFSARSGIMIEYKYTVSFLISHHNRFTLNSVIIEELIACKDVSHQKGNTFFKVVKKLFSANESANEPETGFR